MLIEPLGIEGAWLFRPRIHGDSRGEFLEWFAEPAFIEAIGHPLHLAQANCSVSAAGVVRGIHYADVPPGQAKYLTCVAGAVHDVVVDLRVGSPTFGATETVILNAQERNALYLSEGLGHGFCSLVHGSTVVYLCSTTYAPHAEHEIHPLDPALAIEWPVSGVPQLSPKDAAAPTLSEAESSGILPTWEACRTYRSALRG